MHDLAHPNSKTSEQLKRLLRKLLRKAFEIIVSSKPGQTVNWGVTAEKKRYIYVHIHTQAHQNALSNSMVYRE